MPAGIPKRLTDKLAELGYAVEQYRVPGPPSEHDDGEPFDKFCGVELKHHGRVIGVAEHEPRGWGGDGKWYTFLSRSPNGGAERRPASSQLGRHNRQRDAIAQLLRIEVE